MKKVTYKQADGTPVEVEYDENAPCISCSLPVTSASMAGTAICPWCDMGVYRNGEKWGLQDAENGNRRRQRAREKVNASVN